MLKTKMIAVGLSPLARRTLAPYVIEPMNCRFIPAGAGNSHPAHDGFPHTAVYPRWRGELADILQKRLM
ncbi:hypothetical protein AAS22_002541 [Escherichia coli]|nr:hypothetical protein [Escherichia coli]HAH9712727.1 hypothetical protein [Escherichia coli]HAU8153978.1 hypothetical protein [Escherichia coli]